MEAIKYLSMTELEANMDYIRRSPKDHGVLKMIVRRPQDDEREIVGSAEIDLVQGLIGDNWRTRGSKHTADGSASGFAVFTGDALLVRGSETSSVGGDQTIQVSGSRGTVVTGRIERGIVKVGDEVEIVGIRPTRKVVVTGVEMFKKLLDEGRAGDNVGCLLRGIEREDIERGQVLAKSGSVTPHTTFVARVYVLTKEEGGRHTPFFNGYRPQFYFRTTDVTGAISLPDGAEMIMPGDNVEMGVELITPIALEVGQRFAIREGGRTVGAGAITSIAK